MIQTVHKYRFIVLQTICRYRRFSLPSKKNGPTSLLKNGVPLTYCKNWILKKTFLPFSSLERPNTEEIAVIVFSISELQFLVEVWRISTCWWRILYCQPIYKIQLCYGTCKRAIIIEMHQIWEFQNQTLKIIKWK